MIESSYSQVLEAALVQLADLKKKTAVTLAPLDQVGWLAGQPEELKDWFANNGRWRRFKAGEIIYFQGDEADGLYGLASGEMDISFAPARMEPATVARAPAGAWIGQAALLRDCRRPATLTAVVECRFLFVSSSALRALLADRPEFWSSFFMLVIEHLTRMMDFLAEARYLGPQARIARLLLRLSELQPIIGMNQDEICQLLGMSRSSVRRGLKRLSELGAVEIGYRRIAVSDRVKLEELTGAR